MRDAIKFESFEQFEEDRFKRRQQMAQGIYAGMMTAFIYGRVYITGVLVEKLPIYNKMQRNKAKTELGDIDATFRYQIAKLIYSADKGFLSRLSNKKIEFDKAMETYFLPPEYILNFWDSYCVALAHVFDEALLKRVTWFTRQGLLGGLSEKEMEKYLQQNIGKVIPTHRIKMIARTETTRAFNYGMLDESLKSEMVKGWQFDAVLDEKTTPICRERDGKFIPMDDPTVIESNIPPLHVNCRSMIVPVFNFEDTSGMDKIDMDFTLKYEPKVREIDLDTVGAILKNNNYYGKMEQKELLTPGDTAKMLTFPEVLKNLKEYIKEKGLKFQGKLDTKTYREILQILNPSREVPADDIKIYHRKLSYYAGYCKSSWETADAKLVDGEYIWERTIKKISITIDPRYTEMDTYIHEGLHASRFGAKRIYKDSPSWPSVFEEGSVDFSAKALVYRAFDNYTDIKTGYGYERLYFITQGVKHEEGFKAYFDKVFMARQKGYLWKEIQEMGLVKEISEAEVYETAKNLLLEMYKADPEGFKTQMILNGAVKQVKLYAKKETTEEAIKSITGIIEKGSAEEFRNFIKKNLLDYKIANMLNFYLVEKYKIGL